MKWAGNASPTRKHSDKSLKEVREQVVSGNNKPQTQSQDLEGMVWHSSCGIMCVVGIR